MIPLSRGKKKLPKGFLVASLEATPSYFQRPSACLLIAGSLLYFFGHQQRAAGGSQKRPHRQQHHRQQESNGGKSPIQLAGGARRRSGVAIQVLPQGIVKIIAAILILT